MGATRVSTRPGSVRESWSTSIGSRCSATPNAALRSRRIERLICRAMSPASRNAARRAMTTMPPVMNADCLASSAMAEASVTALSARSDSILR